MDFKNLSFDGLVGKAEELAKKIGRTSSCSQASPGNLLRRLRPSSA